MKATLYNDFHKTNVTVICQEDGRLSYRQSRRVYRELCGIRDCSCAGPCGAVRGDQAGLMVDEVFSITEQRHVLRISVVKETL